MSQELLQRLLDKLTSGDTEAAAEVFTTYAPYLRKVIRRQMPSGLRSKLDSVDVMQSAWGYILEGLRGNNWHFETPAQLQAFLVRVMRNRCIDHCRELHRPLASEFSLEIADPHALPACDRPTAEQTVVAAELWERLLRLCPPEHHAVLQLKREGATNQEIADRTGLHEGSVRRILRQLASRLACEGEPPPDAGPPT